MTEQQQDDRPVPCPACQGTGGVDVGVGAISCSLCENSGETTLARAEAHQKALEEFGNLFKRNTG